MAVRRLHHEQPENFAFSPENQAWADVTIAKYPGGKQASAVIPLLWRGQEQEGWVSEPMITHVAGMLGMAKIRVLEIATFYTMYQLQPVGRKAHVQICGTTPCMLRGAEDLRALCQKLIHADPHHLSDDGNFSWEEVECLGACVNAPMVQIWKDTYEDLTPASLEAILDTFEKGQKPRPGPQIDRHLSAPAGEITTLREPPRGPLGEGGYAGNDKGIGAPGDTGAGVAGASSVAATGAMQPHDQVSPESDSASGGDAAEDAEVTAKLDALPDDASPEERANAIGTRPAGLDGPRGGAADDLKRIKGIGRVNEDKLNELGIYHFDQIANLSRSEILWSGMYLSFPGRIDREDWLGQARALGAGEQTDFSRRVDAGDVESSLDTEEL